MGAIWRRCWMGNGHDITIIDSDQKPLSDVGSLADVITVEGIRRLRRSLRCVRPFIAVNHEENDNVVAAMLAKVGRPEVHRPHRQQRVPRTQQQQEMFIDMGIDYLFYPEKVAAREVINLWGTPRLRSMSIFRAANSLVVFRLNRPSPLVGRQIEGFDDDETPLS